MAVPSHPTAHAAAAGLLLTGGGARAAYQVGVLRAIVNLRRAAGIAGGPSPFHIITGTSAGAINACALACGADNFDEAVRRIVRFWRNVHAGQVYRADSLGVIRTGARWLGLLSLGWLVASWRRAPPQSFLDNAPLRVLLNRMVPLQRLPGLFAAGHLRALAVTASSYTTGEHVTFFDGHTDLQPWTRTQRHGVRQTISPAHLLASSAIPFVFPAIPLPMTGHTEYFGDGSMRQTAPLSAAIHLGAQRLLVIGAGRMTEPQVQPVPEAASQYPSLAQVAGHALSNIFLDALAVDIERAERINQTLTLIPPDARSGSSLRPVELLVIAPSQRLDAAAARHVHALPPPVRAMLGALGMSPRGADVRDAALASYLLFEPSYTRELMALGYADTCTRSEQVCRFFGWPEVRLTAPRLAHP